MPFIRIMIRPLLLCAAFLLPASALASSFAGTSAGASSAGSSASSGSTSGDDKVLLAARDDAAAFVASDGQLRSARLQAALRQLRARDGALAQADDLALARRILAL